MTNYFSILFFHGTESSFVEHYDNCDDFFGITNGYGLIEVPNTPSIQIINGFLSEEDARYIYDYDS